MVTAENLVTPLKEELVNNEAKVNVSIFNKPEKD